MEWLLKVIVIWLSVDVVLIATIWYVVVTVQQLWPDWWARVVADSLDPDS